MGGRNTTINLTNSVERFKGERETKLAQIAKIEAALESLPTLKERVAQLDRLIDAAELVAQENDPDWSAAEIQPRRPTDYTSPIPYGLLGRTALEVMRKAPPEGWPSRTITREVFTHLGLDEPDRLLLDRKSNSLHNYLKANEGDLVESDGAAYYKRWRLIRPK